ADHGRRPRVRGRQPPGRHRPLARVRHPHRRSERLPAARRDPPRRRHLLGRRPRLDERHRRERPAYPAGSALGRRPDHDRHHRPRLPPGEPVTLDSIAVEEALLILKILFLVLLYLFIWRIVRSATRDLRLPQESFVLGPDAAAAIRGGALTAATARLVVVKSPALEEGSHVALDS